MPLTPLLPCDPLVLIVYGSGVLTGLALGFVVRAGLAELRYRRRRAGRIQDEVTHRLAAQTLERLKTEASARQKKRDEDSGFKVQADPVVLERMRAEEAQKEADGATGLK